MKIINKKAIGLSLMIATSSAYYGYLMWNNFPTTRSYGSSNNGYEGYSDRAYQHDLSRPMDRIRYSTDVRAQMRDSMDISPWK